MVCQLLQLFAAENNKDAIFDFPIMTSSQGSMPLDPPYSCGYMPG